MKRWILCIIFSLFSISHLLAQNPGAGLGLSTPPGRYSRDVILQIQPDREYSDLLYRYISFGQSNFARYEDPLVLRTAENSRASYEIELLAVLGDRVVHREFLNYVIDKIPPGPVKLNLPAGRYTRAEEFFPQASDGEEFEITVSSSVNRREIRLNKGEGFSLSGRSGEFTPYAVRAYALDDAGNRSVSADFRIEIDRRQETSAEVIPIVSPVPGDFANRQLLYIDDRGFSNLTYTLDGRDPALGGRSYSGPVLLPPGEDIPLRIRGTTHDGQILQREVRFSASDDSYAELEQGSVSEPLQIPAVRNGLYYRADDRNEVTRFDSPLDRPLRISPQQGSLRALPLRILDNNEKKEYRYLFLLDGRRPRLPALDVLYYSQVHDDFLRASDSAPISRRLRIRSSQQYQTGVRLFYTLDGTAPSAVEERVAKEIFLDEEILLPRDRSEIQLRIQALKNEAVWSEVYARDLSIASNPDYGLEITASRSDGLLNIHGDPPPDTEGLPPSGYRLSLASGAFVTGLLPADGRTEIPLVPGAAPEAELIIESHGASGSLVPEKGTAKLNFSHTAAASPRISIQGEQISISPGNSEDVSRLEYRTILIPDPLVEAMAQEETDQEAMAQEETAQQETNQEIPANNPFLPYETSFSLLPEQDRNLNYIIEARSTDENGVTAFSRSGIVPVHRRAPSAVETEGISSGAALSESPGELRIVRPEPGVRYFYSIGRDGMEASAPDETNPWTLHRLQLEKTPDRSEELVDVRILPISSDDPSLTGAETRIRFSFDTIPPLPPEITGVENASEYASAVELELTTTQENRILYEISREDGERPVKQQTEYNGPFTVTGVDGRRVTYQLRARAEDPAGNLSETAVINFAVDREKPELPNLTILQQGEAIELPVGQYSITSSRDLRIVFDSEDSVLYELRTNGTPPVPGTASSRSGTAIDLQGVQGSEVTYTLLFRSRDSAGNLGAVSNSYQFTIDQESPAPPPEPEIYRDGNGGRISWASADESRIEYALVSGMDRDTADFIRYENEFEWQIPEDYSRMRLLYRSVDSAGNRSRIMERELPRLQVAPVPKLSGIQDGGVYTSRQSIQVYPSSDAIVRYEISSDGSEPDPVDQRSTVWNSRLDFQAAEGETVQYRIRLRQFLPGYEPSRELRFSFTLDRTPPLPPAISGLTSREYIHDNTLIKMEAEEGGQIVYQLRSYSYQSGQLPREWDQDFVPPSSMAGGEFENYQDPFTLRADPGELKLFTIRGYSYDQAGNRSVQDRSWSIVIDKRNVFVDPDSSQTGTGSRSEPFNRLAPALEYARDHNLTEIYLKTGNYPVDAPLRFSDSLSIYGSYDRFWEPDSDDSSYLYADKSFRGDTLIFSQAPSLTLDSLFISDSTRQLESLVRSTAGSMDLSDVRMSVTGGSRGIDSSDTRLSITNSEINGYEMDDGMLLKLRNSRLRMTNSRISAEELPEFLEEGIHSSYILIHSQDSSLDISSSRILPGSGDNTIGLYLYDSSMELDDDSVLGSGFGSSTANALYAENSRLQLRDSTVEGSRKAAVVSLLAVNNSELELSRMKLNLQANFGVKGILITGGSLEIEESSFQAVGAGDFVNAIHARNSAELSVRSSDFTGLTTAEYTLALVEKSSGEFTGNRLALSGEEGFATAYQISGASSLLIKENELTGISGGAAIRLQSRLSDISLEVASNTFENWGFSWKSLPIVSAAPLDRQDATRLYRNLRLSIIRE
ncbi:chitobiase/beta-hexosaminidase C-terminal domain-containing protein [Salinispira pacifica]|uniref:DUF1565 domain-containing protein n=1 Tax=Salinispira pacifica TaxID=1307761 RepID=V5WHC0_9SPIO|nr:chitobiase/beta-hexosaminidase C-terminal domain-containing protein [Salinispira pacifica]AHC15232.1 hypothetical protein L21SP2_1857 [Salinispira pacifica]